jgi:malonyl CoA-acyl carrier protein transacylase
MILNLTGELLQEDADIKQHILDQVIHPVLFTTMLKTTQTLQYTRYIEIGPGNVLSGLLKKTYPDVEIITIAKPIHLEDL